jgi:hypothetical protein
LMVVGCAPTNNNDNKDKGDDSSSSKKNAILLTADTWAAGSFASGGDAQWYTFTATASTQYIHIQRGTMTGSVYVQLYDSAYFPIGDEQSFYIGIGYSSPTYLNTSRPVTSGNVYYMRVWNNSGTYKIGFNTSSDAPVSP